MARMLQRDRMSLRVRRMETRRWWLHLWKRMPGRRSSRRARGGLR